MINIPDEISDCAGTEDKIRAECIFGLRIYTEKNTERKKKKETLERSNEIVFHVNQLMNKCNINHYATYSNKKETLAERRNRSIKNSKWHIFTAQRSYEWLNLLKNMGNPKMCTELPNETRSGGRNCS